MVLRPSLLRRLLLVIPVFVTSTFRRPFSSELIFDSYLLRHKPNCTTSSESIRTEGSSLLLLSGLSTFISSVDTVHTNTPRPSSHLQFRGLVKEILRRYCTSAPNQGLIVRHRSIVLSGTSTQVIPNFESGTTQPTYSQ